MKATTSLLIASGLFGSAAVYGQSVNEQQNPCFDEQQEVAAEIVAEKSAILSIVSEAVSENSNCAGSIVAAAIKASNASDALVGQIVEVAGTVAPSQINTIARAAYVAAPGARGNITAAANRVAASEFSPQVVFPSGDSIPEVAVDGSPVFEGEGDVLLLPPGLILGGGVTPGNFAGSPNERPAATQVDPDSDL